MAMAPGSLITIFALQNAQESKCLRYHPTWVYYLEHKMAWQTGLMLHTWTNAHMIIGEQVLGSGHRHWGKKNPAASGWSASLDLRRLVQLHGAWREMHSCVVRVLRTTSTLKTCLRAVCVLSEFNLFTLREAFTDRSAWQTYTWTLFKVCIWTQYWIRSYDWG